MEVFLSERVFCHKMVHCDYDKKYDVLTNETKIVKGVAQSVSSFKTIVPSENLSKYRVCDFSLSNMIALGVVNDTFVQFPVNNFNVIDKLENSK